MWIALAQARIRPALDHIGSICTCDMFILNQFEFQTKTNFQTVLSLEKDLIGLHLIHYEMMKVPYEMYI